MSSRTSKSRWFVTTLAIAFFIVAVIVLGWRVLVRQEALDAKIQLEGPPPVAIPEDKIRIPVEEMRENP